MTEEEGPPPSKRPRAEVDDDGGALVMVMPSPQPNTAAATTTTTTTRLWSSSLPCPTLQLRGHTGSVYSLQYSPSGHTLCSTSFDKTVLLWSHKEEDDEEEGDGAEVAAAPYRNFNVLHGHKNAVLDGCYLDDECLVTCSADKTVMLWDCATGQRLRKYAEHTGIVNAVATLSPGGSTISVSDDATARLWDCRQKRCASVWQSPYPLLAVAARPSANVLYTSGIDPKIYAWDVRHTQHPVYSMAGHADTVTCLRLNGDHTLLLSQSMDQSLKSWDVQPFVRSLQKRHLQTFVGHRHGPDRGALKCGWNGDGTLVSGGSADGRVHIWDTHSGLEVYDLPGHTGCVNAVTFHPREAMVVASGGSDQLIYVGELSS